MSVLQLPPGFDESYIAAGQRLLVAGFTGRRSGPDRPSWKPRADLLRKNEPYMACVCVGELPNVQYYGTLVLRVFLWTSYINHWQKPTKFNSLFKTATGTEAATGSGRSGSLRASLPVPCLGATAGAAAASQARVATQGPTASWVPDTARVVISCEYRIDNYPGIFGFRPRSRRTHASLR